MFFLVSHPTKRRDFKTTVVCDLNPFEKYARQIGFHLPKNRGDNSKKSLKPPANLLPFKCVKHNHHLLGIITKKKHNPGYKKIMPYHFSDLKPPPEPRKKPSYFPLYWLVNRDPYNGLLKSLYNWVV